MPASRTRTLTGAVFDHALANGTSFDSVIAATNTRFVGAHVYGMGDAFEGARELTGADFTDAVLGGDDDGHERIRLHARRPHRCQVRQRAVRGMQLQQRGPHGRDGD